MSTTSQKLIGQIHGTPTRFVLAASGGGAGAMADLLSVPGASRTVLETTVPYSEPSLVALLGGRPDQFCSERTARAMAMAAFRRAVLYHSPADEVAGVGCTSALVTDRPKAGPHRTHIALQTARQTAFWSLELTKGARSRPEEEAIVDGLVLNAVAAGCGLEDRLELPLREGENLVTGLTDAPQSWCDLLLGYVDTVREGEMPTSAKTEAPRAILPGEFNPMHVGHQRMAEVAGDVLGIPVEFEISVTNVDKPPLDYYEIERRVGQFRNRYPVWLTRASRFVEKSRLFPGATFVVGIDTLRRIASPRYYGDDASACNAALRLIVGRGCRFLVFGRNLGTGFVAMRDLDLPDVLLTACREVPSDRFREDISSTALRRSGAW